jgi:hypothetical protein
MVRIVAGLEDQQMISKAEEARRRYGNTNTTQNSVMFLPFWTVIQFSLLLLF